MIEKNVIIIHGCSDDEEEAMSPENRTYDKHWIPWIKKELTVKGIKTEAPLMPEPWRPKYERFREEFEKYDVNEHTILIGHSCGCAFLVRWLGETKKEINKLILVAPWKMQSEEAKKRDNDLYNYNIDETIKERVDEIIIFTADNEKDEGKKGLEIFHNAFGGKIIDIKGYGHYCLEDMGTEEFPKLLEVITK